MPIARCSALVDRPPDVVWQQLADLASWPHWMLVPYASESVSVISAGEPVAGTEFVMRGRRMKWRLFARITEWMPERQLAFEIYRSEYPSDRFTFGRAVIRIDLEPADQGRTRVICEHRLEGLGLLGRLYAATVMRPLIKTNAQRMVDGLTRTPR